jgi:hypothetical protein
VAASHQHVSDSGGSGLKFSGEEGRLGADKITRGHYNFGECLGVTNGADQEEEPDRKKGEVKSCNINVTC